MPDERPTTERAALIVRTGQVPAALTPREVHLTLTPHASETESGWGHATTHRRSKGGPCHACVRSEGRNRHPDRAGGSLPRPNTLQQAYAAYDGGSIQKDDLEREQDAAVEDTIEHLEGTGSTIISDGEQRWSSFATYPLTDTLAGTGLADHLAGGGQYFAIFADGHSRQLPKLTSGPFRYRTYAADTLRKAIPLAHKPMKSKRSSRRRCSPSCTRWTARSTATRATTSKPT